MAEMTEDLKLAIYGYNAATGKAYTPEESAAANAGYNPYAGYTEAKFDPVKGEVTAINPLTGQSMTLGAKFRTSGTGGVVPAESSRPPGVGYDDSGRPYGPGQIIPGESLEAYIARMAQLGPGQLGYGGKTYLYNSRGMFYEVGTPEPVGFVDTLENMADTPSGRRAAANASQMGTRNVTTTNKTGGDGTTYTGSGTTADPFKLNGAPFTGNLGGVNYVSGIKEDTAKRTAQQDFRAALAELGLADLADTVDNLIRQDYTVAQIKLELPKQQAYKDRFPGMQALREAGQAVNEATYISMERGYLQTLAAYGLDARALGSRKQLGTYVSNLVSPREFEERVNLAATRVKDNADVIAQFKTYYPEVDNSALTAYLLNPMVGMDIIKKQVRLSEIGAAAMDVGFASGVSLSTAEELRGAVGEQDYQTVRTAFSQAKVLADQQSRLARIEGTGYSETEAIKGIVGRDIQSQMASQKRAERETMTRFGGTSGVTSTSLRTTEGI
jgi:hypothetical protein